MLRRVPREIEDPALETRVEISMGRVYESMGEKSNASSAYSSAELAATCARDGALDILASLFHERVRVGQGDDLIQVSRSLDISRRSCGHLGDPLLKAFATALLAEIAAWMHDIKRAERLRDEARSLAASAKGKPTVLLGGEVEEALERAERAIEGKPEPAPPVPTPPVPTHQKVEPAHQAKVNVSPTSAEVPRPRYQPARDRLIITVGLAAALVTGLLMGIFLTQDHAPSDPWFCFIDREDRPRCFQSQATCEDQLKTQGGVTRCRMVRSFDLGP